MVRCRRVAAAADIFGEKNIAGPEGHARAVTNTDIDSAGQGNYPAPSGSTMPVNNVRREIISK